MKHEFARLCNWLRDRMYGEYERMLEEEILSGACLNTWL